MNETTITSQKSLAVANNKHNKETNFSLLHDDDDEEVMPSFVGEKKSALQKELNDNSNNNIKGNVATYEEDSYDSILQQTTKWIVELEQIRDTTTWCHVENSFHRDVFAMMDIQTSFNYPSI
jgi:hypothetical protein